MQHVPVLLSECLDALALVPGANVVDCTLGDGGHSEAILEATSPDGKLLGFDADPESLARAEKRLAEFAERITLVNKNFVHLGNVVHETSFGPVNGILMDLGWSSPQFAERGRGFSFQTEEPLDMRFTPADGGDTAADILNTWNASELAEIFTTYAEERQAKRIATKVVETRKTKPYKTTTDIVNTVLEVYREVLQTDAEVPWVGGNHPATKTFQALRIAVNNELDVLEKTINQAIDVLAPGGRLAIISFHSLEDRIVKHQFKALAAKETVQIETKKPIVPTDDECKQNIRARSAKLRVCTKI